MIPYLDLRHQYEALKQDIDQGIQRVLDHTQFVMGPEIKDCETALAEFANTKFALTAGSGTDAALMAMMALGIGPGDEVITTAFSFIATAETIVLLGATPVFVDIDNETFNIDVNAIESVITEKTKAIQPVGLYGQPADMDPIFALAKKHNLHIIEDAAQSFGAKYKDRVSGGLGTLGATSFFPAKPLGCYGDGGAVFTDDPDLATRVEQLRNHGSEARYHHTSIGINGRFDTLQGAVILAKLKRYPWEIEQRQRIAKTYTAGLKNKVSTPLVREDRDSVWAQYTIRVPERDRVQSALRELGVPTTVHYPCTMPDQPAYRELGRVHDIENSRRAAKEVLSLPLYPDMPQDHIEQVIDAIGKVI